MINNAKKSFDLEERTLRFSCNIVEFCKTVSSISILKSISNQLIRSATSVGANYCEANNASSKKDFKNKIFICKKEAQETEYWLKVIIRTHSDLTKKVDPLLDEAHQLVLIFQKITSSMSK